MWVRLVPGSIFLKSATIVLTSFMRLDGKLGMVRKPWLSNAYTHGESSGSDWFFRLRERMPEKVLLAIWNGLLFFVMGKLSATAKCSPIRFTVPYGSFGSFTK